jgi:DNA-binding response OmpR family regulator
MGSILVIEDTIAVRVLFRAILESDGHQVREAAHGEEGLHEFRRCPAELVVTDLYMPDGDGIELIVRLRREWPTVKILAVSGGIGMNGLLHAAKLLGADCALAKPVGVEELQGAVRTLLGLGRQAWAQQDAAAN